MYKASFVVPLPHHLDHLHTNHNFNPLCVTLIETQLQRVGDTKEGINTKVGAGN